MILNLFLLGFVIAGVLYLLMYGILFGAIHIANYINNRRA